MLPQLFACLLPLVLLQVFCYTGPPGSICIVHLTVEIGREETWYYNHEVANTDGSAAFQLQR